MTRNEDELDGWDALSPRQRAAYARSTARYGRRHHDTDDRWQPYRNTGQDMD